MAVRLVPAAARPAAAQARSLPHVPYRVFPRSGVPVPRAGSPPPLTSFGQWLKLAESAEDHDGFAFLIFRRGIHLVAVEIERDADAWFAGRREMQCVPVDGDLAAADAKESAKVDD